MGFRRRITQTKGFLAPLRVRNFRLLWIGETVSVLGDQFYFVALPWLTLQLTTSGLALGSVMMTAAISRSALMLAGGAVTDRFSSRTVMLISNVVRCMLVVVLAALVHAHAVRLTYLYIFASAYGCFDAFFYPAYSSMVPSLLEPTQVAAGNSLMQASGQLSSLIGPATAGAVIGAAGLAAAFRLDAASFLISITTLALIRSVHEPALKRREPLLRSIGVGISYSVSHPIIRSLLIAFATINMFLTGPFVIGAPLLARVRFGGVTALGLFFSSLGTGALLGTIAAGHHRREHRLGPLLVTAYGCAGLTMIVLSVNSVLWFSAVILLVQGLIAGYINVRMLAYLQCQTTPDKIGRVMSLVMLSGQALIPLSYVLAGAISKISVTVLFLGSGVTVALLTPFLFRAPQLWRKEGGQTEQSPFLAAVDH